MMSSRNSIAVRLFSVLLGVVVFHIFQVDVQQIIAHQQEAQLQDKTDYAHLHGGMKTPGLEKNPALQLKPKKKAVEGLIVESAAKFSTPKKKKATGSRDPSQHGIMIPPNMIRNSPPSRSTEPTKRFASQQYQRPKKRRRQHEASAQELEELRERARRRRIMMANYTRPRLDTIVSPKNDTILSDPQFLLDFVIAGFGKCGTSSIMHWLGDHPEVQSFPDEIWELMRSNPKGLVTMLYNELPPGHYKRGYKSPGEITQPHILKYFTDYWPKTKLIVGIRHPIDFFQSLYNFRVQNLEEGQEMLGPNQLIGRCHGKANQACTSKASFAYYLIRLGKTNYNGTGWRKTTELEEEIVGRFKRNWYNVSETPYVPNHVFLFELRQLSDTNTTRSNQFRQDIQSFLGLKQDLAEMIHHKPGQTFGEETQKEKDRKKIDICDEQYKPVRRELLQMSRQGSLWIRSVFLDIPDVHVSSRPYLESILEDWMHDPCVNGTKVTRATRPS